MGGRLLKSAVMKVAPTRPSKEEPATGMEQGPNAVMKDAAIWPRGKGSALDMEQRGRGTLAGMMDVPAMRKQEDSAVDTVVD